MFGVEINGTTLRWYVDNVTVYHHVPTPQTDPSFAWGSSSYMPFSDMFMILNTAVATWGCAQPVPLKGWGTPTTMAVDWVRAYQWQPTAGQAGGAGDAALLSTAA